MTTPARKESFDPGFGTLGTNGSSEMNTRLEGSMKLFYQEFHK